MRAFRKKNKTALTTKTAKKKKNQFQKLLPIYVYIYNTCLSSRLNRFVLNTETLESFLVVPHNTFVYYLFCNLLSFFFFFYRSKSNKIISSETGYSRKTFLVETDQPSVVFSSHAISPMLSYWQCKNYSKTYSSCFRRNNISTLFCPTETIRQTNCFLHSGNKAYRYLFALC